MSFEAYIKVLVYDRIWFTIGIDRSRVVQVRGIVRTSTSLGTMSRRRGVWRRQKGGRLKRRTI